MTPAARAFYNRHFLLTVLLPAYLLALLFYGTAWLLIPQSGRPLSLAFVFMLGLSRIFSWLGFMASGVPQAAVQPDGSQRRRLQELLAPLDSLPSETGDLDQTRKADATGAEQDASAQLSDGLRAVQLLELGDVPYLAAGGLQPGQVWISTYTLDHEKSEVLRCLLQHELAHGRQQRGCLGSIAWADLTWLLAYPVAWLAFHAGQPLVLLLAALVHVSLWLHLGQLLRQRSEKRTDLAAAGLLGRERYARALAVHLAQFEAPPPLSQQGRGDERGIQLRLNRLGGLGYSRDEALELIRTADSR